MPQSCENCEDKENVCSPDRDAMLGLRVPGAANTVKEEGGGQGGTKHMACPEEEEN